MIEVYGDDWHSWERVAPMPGSSHRRCSLSLTTQFLTGALVQLDPAAAVGHHRAVAGRRLTRSKTDRKIAGVAGGIAEYFGLDPTILRAVWVVSVVFGGFGVLAYVILWIVLPEEADSRPAVQIAEERFAHGEITAEELRRIRADLRGEA